jgi:hypothetical protein
MTHCPCFIGIRSCVMSLQHIMDQDALIMLVKLWCNLECLFWVTWRMWTLCMVVQNVRTFLFSLVDELRVETFWIEPLTTQLSIEWVKPILALVFQWVSGFAYALCLFSVFWILWLPWCEILKIMYSLAALHGKYEAGPPSAPRRSQKKFTSPHNPHFTL